MADLAVVIRTLNEQRHICRALNSISSMVREVSVVDSSSTDRTVELARGRALNRGHRRGCERL